jgi:hypothetical protein
MREIADAQLCGRDVSMSMRLPWRWVFRAKWVAAVQIPCGASELLVIGVTVKYLGCRELPSIK